MITTDISIDLLRTYIDLCPDTGKLFYKEKSKAVEPRDRERGIFNTQFAGKEAFYSVNTHGYLAGTIFSKRFLAHRVVWALYYGKWPDQHIDHINGDKTDNRICNLRSVSQKQNLRNMKKSKANTSGHTGVFWSKNANKWTAQIRSGGKAIHLGYFASFDDAVDARKKANASLQYHPNHGR